jgi:hypothetical protein
MAIDERYFYGAHGIDIEKAKQERILRTDRDGLQDALDKIRAEIIENAKSTMNDTRAEGLYMALNIVDKYKAGSEDKG